MSLSTTQKKSIEETPIEEIRTLLIRFLAAYSVRKDMCLPILLMVGKSREKMVELMLFMRENDPTEHQTIQEAIRLSE